MSRHNTLTTILHNVVAQYLRHFVKREWDQCYPHMPWTDDNSSLANFLKLEKNKKKASTNLKNSGDRNSWDLTTLFFVLLYSDSIGQKLKNQPQPIYYTAINRLRLNRNAVSHVSPSTYTSNNNFRNRYNEIKQCLNDLGFPDAHQEMDDVVKQQSHSSGGTLTQLTAVAIIIGLLAVLYNVTLTVKTPEDAIIPNKSFNGTVNSENVTSSEYIEGQDLHPSSFSLPLLGNPQHLTNLKDDFNKLTQYVLSTEFNLVSVVGPQGTGKTTLSIAVAKHLQDEYLYTVAYANLHKTTVNSITSVLTKLLSHLGFHHIQQVVFPNLIVNHHKRVLVILEDVDYAAEVYHIDFLHFLTNLVNFKHITVVTTSRLEWDWSRLDGKTLYLDHLTCSQSTGLLLSVYPNITTTNAEEIAKTVHNMKFLLEIIGHGLKSSVYSVEGILSELPQIGSDANSANLATFIPIIQVLISKIDLKLRIQLLKNGLGIKEGWNAQSNDRLAQLGFLQYRTTPKGSQIVMHRFLRQFAQQKLLSKHDIYYLENIQPLHNIVTAGIALNILGSFVQRKDYLIFSIMRLIFISLGIVIGYFITDKGVDHFPPTYNWVSSTSVHICQCAVVICFLHDLLYVRWLPNLWEHIFHTAMHLLFCCLFTVFICYISYFIFIYIFYFKSPTGDGPFAIIMSRNQASFHFVIYLVLGSVTLYRNVNDDFFRRFHWMSKHYHYFNFASLGSSMFLCFNKAYNIHYNIELEYFISKIHIFAIVVGLIMVSKSSFFFIYVILHTMLLTCDQYLINGNLSVYILPIVMYPIATLCAHVSLGKIATDQMEADQKRNDQKAKVQKNSFAFFSASYLNWILYILITVFANESTSNFQLKTLSFFAVFDFQSFHIIIACSTLIMSWLLNDQHNNKAKSVILSCLIAVTTYQTLYVICYMYTGDRELFYYIKNTVWRHDFIIYIIPWLESLTSLPAITVFCLFLTTIRRRTEELYPSTVLVCLVFRLISISILHSIYLLYLAYSML